MVNERSMLPRVAYRWQRKSDTQNPGQQPISQYIVESLSVFIKNETSSTITCEHVFSISRHLLETEVQKIEVWLRNFLASDGRCAKTQLLIDQNHQPYLKAFLKAIFENFTQTSEQFFSRKKEEFFHSKKNQRKNLYNINEIFLDCE